MADLGIRLCCVSLRSSSFKGIASNGTVRSLDIVKCSYTSWIQMETWGPNQNGGTTTAYPRLHEGDYSLGALYTSEPTKWVQPLLVLHSICRFHYDYTLLCFQSLPSGTPKLLEPSFDKIDVPKLQLVAYQTIQLWNQWWVGIARAPGLSNGSILL